MQKPLPKHIWIGYLIAGMLVVEKFIAGLDPSATRRLEIVVILSTVTGLLYWFYLVYRIHAVLAVVTANNYPISPAKAIILQLLPFVNLYWTLRWPTQIAVFVNSHSSAPRMRKRRAALLILLGWILLGFDSGLGLTVLFGALSLIERRVAEALPSAARQRTSSEFSRHQLEAIQVALVAIFGTAIGFIFFLGAKNITESRTTTLEFFVVAAVMALVFEPALERVQRMFVVAFSTVAIAESPQAWSGGPMAGGAILVTEMLRDSIHDAMNLFDLGAHGELTKLALILFMMLLPSGTITYAWARGVAADQSRAAIMGGVSGCLSGLAYGQALGLFLAVSHGDTALLYPLLWGAVGLAGGLVIDRGWFAHTSNGVALAIFIIVLAGVGLYPLLHVKIIWWWAAFARATGWGVGLIVYAPANTVLTAQSREHLRENPEAIPQRLSNISAG